MHQRVGSNSTRINIPASPKKDRHPEQHQAGRTRASSTAAPSLKSRIFGRSNVGGPLITSSSSSSEKKDRVSEDGRAGAGRGTIRVTRRQLGLLALATLALYLLATRSSTGYNASDVLSGAAAAARRPRTRYTSSGVPIVDRKVMNKLQELDIQSGYTDQDEMEAREAGRLPPSRGKDGPPPLYHLPDGKAKPKPKASTEEAFGVGRSASLLPASQIDKEYCPTHIEGCKFLFAAWLGEQETKAQMHLHQLGLLALSLNRTLVLPNVSKSRMMSCSSQPFEFYYAADSLDKLGVPTISFAKMAEWSRRRHPAPTAQIVTVANTNPDLPSGAMEVETEAVPTVVASSPKRKLCLEPPKTYLDFSSFSPIAAYPPAGWHKAPETRLLFGESLINTLKSPAILEKAWRKNHEPQQPFLSSSPAPLHPSPPDVLVFNYELRYPMLTPEFVQDGLPLSSSPSLQPFSHFPYDSSWTSLAEQLSASLSPFIAVHWRQETLPSSVISPCGDALINKLDELLSTPIYSDIKTVYLATDYPIEDLENGRDGVTSHSGTFAKLITEEHHIAMTKFLKNFKIRLFEPRGIRLTTFSKEQPNLKLPPGIADILAGEEGTAAPAYRRGKARYRKAASTPAVLDLADLDAGLLGIIDKTVAMQAQVFLTGQPWSGKDAALSACAKESSFTKQISEARKAVKREEAGTKSSKLRNEVYFWFRQAS